VVGTLTLRVITPDKIALDSAVGSVTIPGMDGQIGILPRHAPMVAALDAGQLSYEEGGARRAIFVSGGFCEVRGATVRVVTEAGEKPAEIDVERAKAAERRARERIAARREDGKAPVDLLRAEAALKRALLRLRTASEGA
jgi:F-type H+-transporting ATPase subunit epsilon